MRQVVFVLLIVSLFAACTEKSEEGNETATQGQQGLATEDAEGGPIEMIPDEGLSEFEKLAKGYLRPYFDEAGTVTEKALSDGDQFDIYLFAEFDKGFPMSAAEYKLVLPPGVAVMGETKSDSVILTMGNYHDDFLLAFRCSHGPRLWLMKYQCIATDTFEGGTIRTTKGDNLNFLGFTMCDATKTLIGCLGGSAVLSKK